MRARTSWLLNRVHTHQIPDVQHLSPVTSFSYSIRADNADDRILNKHNYINRSLTEWPAMCSYYRLEVGPIYFLNSFCCQWLSIEKYRNKE